MNAKGCFTQDKYIAGKSLKQIEKILGFQERRLSRGALVLAITRLPRKGEFRVAGYTNVSLHNFRMSPNLDVDVLEELAMEQWQLSGPDRLVKVMPTIRHDSRLDPDIQYPHAAGVPQWEVLVELPCIVTAVLRDYPGQLYPLSR